MVIYNMMHVSTTLRHVLTFLYNHVHCSLDSGAAEGLLPLQYDTASRDNWMSKFRGTAFSAKICHKLKASTLFKADLSLQKKKNRRLIPVLLESTTTRLFPMAKPH